MNKEKLIEYYKQKIKIYKKIEEFNKEISVLVEIISNSQSMNERINGGQFD
ncbi:hypothetical protein [Spiroplasma ixodetis]|uniref:hypothetical protein n=1 Tax=Spiroplasma ixodetis TaxID=2141 RepID=UPI0025770166|nr:hypothetical protein [Spiroplasma ixodetis]WJG70483.1 hypothetical protein SIXOD_v1c16500 [Spiroplasma ixodetis Y32]